MNEILLVMINLESRGGDVRGGLARDDQVSAQLQQLCAVTWWDEFQKENN